MKKNKKQNRYSPDALNELLEPILGHVGSAQVGSDSVRSRRLRLPHLLAGHIGKARDQKKDAKELENFLLVCERMVGLGQLKVSELFDDLQWRIENAIWKNQKQL